MNKRTGNIIISLLVLIIAVSGVYIVKTLFTDESAATQNDRAQVTVTAEPTAEAAEPTESAQKADTSYESAAMRQASENDPAKAKEVSRPAGSYDGIQQIAAQSSSKIIVLDPGHGKSSSLMSAEEKAAEGYVRNSNGNWGEWRHWKSGTSNEPCYASGCTGRAPSGASCWYPMGNGDRATEPEINLNNALSARKYLEQMGYTVRMTRTSNDQNPSFSKRISYCYPNNDNAQNADAEVYVCIHSNAAGGSVRGSAYISAGGLYDQKMKNGANSTYADNCNTLGRMINARIVAQTSLSQWSGGSIGGEEALIAFCKSPVPVGYVEIGFFDNSSDLSILRSEYDRIGQSIAEGIDDYLKTH